MIPMGTHRRMVRAIGAFVGIASLIAGVYYWSGTVRTADITLQVYDRSPEQRQYLIDRFQADWYWLIEGNIDIYPMLDQARTWSGYTDVHIVLAKYKGDWAGFAIYFKKTPERGLFQFLDVAPAYRGKRVSDALLRYALQDLKNMGCSSVELITRVQNKPAQKLYTKHGFIMTWNDGMFLHFERTL